MSIKHPNLKLAACCLLAATLLPACGGSNSSSSAGASDTGSRTYQQGYAAGTVATLDIVLEDLTELQRSLAGSDASAQTSRDTLGRSFAALLEPRQRETLARSLLTFIARVTEARNAADAAGAGQDEATAAQTAADEALQALRLVVAADTAARAGGGAAAQTAAINALNQIARVDAAAPDATTRINTALEAAVRAAEAEVARLEAALAAAQAPGEEPVDVAGLRQQLVEARSRLNELTPGFGSPPAAPAARRASVTYHPRRTGVQMVFDTSSSTSVDDARTTGNDRRDARVFSPVPVSSWREGIEYDVTNFGVAATGGFDLTPDPVVYRRTGSNRRVFASTNPHLGHFPGRGTVFRTELRRTADNDSNTGNNGNGNSRRVYQSKYRLAQQGQRHLQSYVDTSKDSGAAGAVDAVDGVPYMTFQYKTGAGFTMGFGGNGVAFADTERYAIKSHLKNCNAGSSVEAGGGSEFCNDATVANIEISFGAPRASSYDERGTNYWLVQVPSPRLEADTTPDFSVGSQAGNDNRIAEQDMGSYELWLSNYAGADSGAAGDTHRYLSYAAYGLFKYNGAGRLGRFSTFHYGVDSFGPSNPLPTEAGGSFTGTFKGRTRGFVVTSRAPRSRAGWGLVETLYHLRGDLALTAKIGTTGNRVEGTISNLQFAYGNTPGVWTQSGNAGIPHGLGGRTIELQDTGIGANGAYSGTAHPTGGGLGLFDGHYEGTFYGPAGTGMETAGTWWLPVNNSDGGETVDGLVGSFGAVCTDNCTPGTTP